MNIRRGTLIAFNTTTKVASVALDGDLSTFISVPANRGIADAVFIAGRDVAVAVSDANPEDAVVLAVWTS